jgi:hypothetical protein
MYSDLKVIILKSEAEVKAETAQESLNAVAGIMDDEVLVVPKKKKKGIELLEQKKDKHILLNIWVIACIIASFITAIILSTVVTTYIQNTSYEYWKSNTEVYVRDGKYKFQLLM